MPEMTPDEVLALLTPLFSSNGLSDTQELVLRESWQGKSYQQIAQTFEYDTDYIKGVGSRLWRSLSQSLGKPVTKANLHSVINGYAHQTTSRTSGLSMPMPKALVDTMTLVSSLIQASCRALRVSISRPAW